MWASCPLPTLIFVSFVQFEKLYLWEEQGHIFTEDGSVASGDAEGRGGWRKTGEGKGLEQWLRTLGVALMNDISPSHLPWTEEVVQHQGLEQWWKRGGVICPGGPQITYLVWLSLGSPSQNWICCSHRHTPVKYLTKWSWFCPLSLGGQTHFTIALQAGDLARLILRFLTHSHA